LATLVNSQMQSTEEGAQTNILMSVIASQGNSMATPCCQRWSVSQRK